LDLAQYIQAVHLGQFQVEQNQFGRGVNAAVAVRSATKKEIQRLFAITHHVDLAGEIVSLKGNHRQLHVVGIVFDQQDFDFVSFHTRGFEFFTPASSGVPCKVK